MKVSEKQMARLVSFVLKEMKAGQVVTFKAKDGVIHERATKALVAELQKEAALDKEVQRMMDELERQNPGGFERYKMFPLLKKRLAKEKGVVL